MVNEIENDTIVIIPARLASTRLPKKPLADINGLTLIERVYFNVCKYTTYKTVVASGDQKLSEYLSSKKIDYVETEPALPSGSDRIWHASRDLNNKNIQHIVNFQGDAVNVDPRIITELVEMQKTTNCDIATCAIEIHSSMATQPDTVKVVVAFKEKNYGRALYFSRAAIPYSINSESKDYLHHIGIYVYKPSALEKFISLRPSKLERLESLEQLRALENDLSIFVKKVDRLKLIDEAPADIDTKEELELSRQYIN